MTDITHQYLEAAIIDQNVAGAFPDKAYAFVAVVNGGYSLGVAVANEKGYNADHRQDLRQLRRSQALGRGS